MKNKLLSLGAAAILFAVTSCSHIPPTPVCKRLNNLVETVKPAELSMHYQGKSDYIVALIPNVHNSFECHANTYLTLESLKDDIFFVAREGRHGDSVHSTFTGPYFKHGSDIETREPSGLIEDFIKLPLEERTAKMHNWIESSTLPEGKHEQMNDKNMPMPIKSSFMFEVVYQDEVESFGVENLMLLLDASYTYGQYEKAKKLYEKGLISKEELTQKEEETGEKILSRQEKFVENIEYVAENLKMNRKKLVPFVVGAIHIEGLRRMFEEEEISYIVLEHEECASDDIDKSSK